MEYLEKIEEAISMLVNSSQVLETLFAEPLT